MSSNDDIKELTIAELFNSDKYIIPRYQRNYAWEEKEITQLIRDIFDFALDEDKSRANYYIGTLVIFERSSNGQIHYETIDGQQRLTTLNLLISAIKRNFDNIDEIKNFDFQLNLKFDSRVKSTTTLEAIADLSSSNEKIFLEGVNYNPNIRQGFKDAEKYLLKILKNEANALRFFKYLTKKVKVFRVKVPHDTDLNHYFEIMNNRGEQLEKHEILKAKMLELFKNKNALKYTFNLIWEACSDMERYVQYGFSISERKSVFEKNWDTLKSSDLNSMADSLYSISRNKSQDNHALSINEIIHPSQRIETVEKENSREAERFTSVVTFPNFLLHVLRILTKENIPLDDKRLLDTFKKYIDKGEDFVLEFGSALLKARYLFDKYIIKREILNEKEQWSLKRLQINEENKKSVSYVNTLADDNNERGLNKEIIMRLAMFHVSAPTQIYKHWLNAALNWVFHNGEHNYLEYLNNLSKAFLFDRFLSNTPLDYFDIIYSNDGIPQRNETDARWDFLDKGTQVENFIFNYLDFELWKKKYAEYDKFDFAFRSSVEHYYPQNPVANIERMDKDVCDNFGNLCLLSSSKNSKLTNHTPEAKKDFYKNAGIDSLKQNIMINYNDEWNQKAIEAHALEMITILKDVKK